MFSKTPAIAEAGPEKFAANPPPGAVEQAIGTNRPGNNYTAAPFVKWYDDTTEVNNGPFNLKVIETKKCKN